MLIIGFSGRKISGKNSCCNWISGKILEYLNLVTSTEVNEQGHLVTEALLSNGEIVRAPVDLTVPNNKWLQYHVWPHVKIYSMADYMKQIGIDLFGIKREQLYGTDEQKRTATQIKWKDFRGFLDAQTRNKFEKEPEGILLDGYLTGRGFLQMFGTNICRKLFSDCWVNACLATIQRDQSDLPLICDVRFPNEVEKIQKAGGKVIRLTRCVYPDDTHDSETALDGYEGYDYTIDNQNLKMGDQFEILKSISRELNIFPI